MPRSSSAKAPLWLLVLITLSGTLAMHMFVPALPAAAADFGVGSAAMQAAISVYILGLAGGQLLYGPVSDGLGRRPMLLLGLGLYSLAGLAAALAPSAHALVGARLLQALGGCAGLALGRAMVRDTSNSEDAVGDLALLNLMIMIGPGLAPLLGSLLADHFGWRTIFLLLAGIGGVTWCCAWRLLPETGRPSGQFSPRALLGDYRRLLRQRAFQGFALGGACTTTSVYGFIVAAPFIFTRQLQRPLHEVGIYLGLLIIGMSLGNALTRRLVRTLAVERLLLAGSALCLACATLFLGLALAGALSVALLTGLMFLHTLGAGLVSPAAMTKALGVDEGLIGSAAGAYGFTQMLVAAVCTTAVGIGGNPALSAALVLLAATLLGQLALRHGLAGERAAAC